MKEIAVFWGGGYRRIRHNVDDAADGDGGTGDAGADEPANVFDDDDDSRYNDDDEPFATTFPVGIRHEREQRGGGIVCAHEGPRGRQRFETTLLYERGPYQWCRF